MSDQTQTCPECGADGPCYRTCADAWDHYHYTAHIIDGDKCLRRQLVQAKEREATQAQTTVETLHDLVETRRVLHGHILRLIELGERSDAMRFASDWREEVAAARQAMGEKS